MQGDFWNTLFGIEYVTNLFLVICNFELETSFSIKSRKGAWGRWEKIVMNSIHSIFWVNRKTSKYFAKTHNHSLHTTFTQWNYLWKPSSFIKSQIDKSHEVLTTFQQWKPSAHKEEYYCLHHFVWIDSAGAQMIWLELKSILLAPVINYVQQRKRISISGIRHPADVSFNIGVVELNRTHKMLQ